MAKKRIFTAINLPKEAKRELISHQKKWEDLPVRWTPPQNLHVTLVFIGSVEQVQLEQIKGVTEKVAEASSPFSLSFHNITLGPPGKPPRMFWVEGKRNEEIVELHEKLEDSLARVKNTGLQEKESRTYKPHITLGRINKEEWRQMKQQPTINEEISLKVEVDSIEVMESELKSSRAEYSTIKSCGL